jgi:hypothetical protein
MVILAKSNISLWLEGGTVRFDCVSVDRSRFLYRNAETRRTVKNNFVIKSAVVIAQALAVDAKFRLLEIS